MWKIWLSTKSDDKYVVDGDEHQERGEGGGGSRESREGEEAVKEKRKE